MPGDSLQRDLADVLEFYGEDERCGYPSPLLAKYLVDCLEAFRTIVRFGWAGIPAPVTESPAQNAEATPDGKGWADPAYKSVSLSDPNSSGGSHG